MGKKRIGIVLMLVALMIGILFAMTVLSSANEEGFVPKMSITLSESLVFNIYVPKDDALCALKLDGEEIGISNLNIKDGYYHIAVSLPASEADRDISLIAEFEENEQKSKVSFTFSTIKYVKKLLASNASDTTKKLGQDILAYINSAKLYFEEDASEKISEVLAGYSYEPQMNTAENKTPGVKLATFVLGAVPSVRFYLADGYSTDDFEFFVKEVRLTPVFGSDENGAYLEFKAYAYNMIESFKYTVKGGDDSGAYNLASYYSFVCGEYNKADKANLTDLVKKFYSYCESASNYRTEVIQSMCEHSYSDTVKEKATPSKEGVMQHVCSVCGHTYESAIPTTLKVLAIGNSFSQDAYEHLYLVAKAAGIENVVLGNLYKGGCSLATHWKNVQDNLSAYTFYISSEEKGGMVAEGTRTMEYGLDYADWDYITIQQASNHSGMSEKYGDLQNIIDYVKSKKSPDTKIFWHMTWAYQQDSTHSGFANYSKDQMTMYNSILSVVQELILTNPNISGVIPSGTAIQNLRTSELGDTLTRDGYHLSYGIGRYTAAMTWIAYITGLDIDKITAVPTSYPEVAEYLDHIKDAVNKAIAKPFEVTDSAYPALPSPETPDKLLNTTLSELSDEDREYLSSNGFDPDHYMLLDFDIAFNAFYNSTHSTYYAVQETQSSTSSQSMKWWSTQVFSKSELITGSVIRSDAGIKYRPEGWIDMQKNSLRPDVITATTDTYVIVDDEWWGAYNYRAFNVGKEKGAAFTQEEYDAIDDNPSILPFKVYIPIVKRAELNSDDIAYLESQGLDSAMYQVLDFEYTLDAHYNSGLRGAVASASTGNVKYKYVATEVFSKYDLKLGTVIRIAGSNHNYRPEGWINYTEKHSARPVIVSAVTTVVDASWWGNFTYRGFNIQKTGATQENPVTDADASAVRIYIPKDVDKNGLTAEDRAYLESLDLNPDEYKLLELDINANSYYDSSTGFSQRHDNSTSVNYNKFLATQIFTKNELTIGSVIRVKNGYKYRPEGWIDLNTKNEKANRPANVSVESVIIDDAWWGSFNYRAFNIGKTNNTTISESEKDNFKIYVRIA